MKEIKNIRSGLPACALLLLSTIILAIASCKVSYVEALTTDSALAGVSLETTKMNDTAVTLVENETATVVGAAPEEMEVEVAEVVQKTTYDIPDRFVNPETGATVRYRGGKTLERSHKITRGEAGRINRLAIPDSDGFMKLDDRYLVAIGQRFNTIPGQYFDLVLENGVVIPCMMGDAKANCDTDSTNTFTYHSSCCSEFIIDKYSIRSDINQRGNASLKYPEWDSPVVQIVVYDQYFQG